jgi:hypothetical protein
MNSKAASCGWEGVGVTNNDGMKVLHRKSWEVVMERDVLFPTEKTMSTNELGAVHRERPTYTHRRHSPALIPLATPCRKARGLLECSSPVKLSARLFAADQPPFGNRCYRRLLRCLRRDRLGVRIGKREWRCSWLSVAKRGDCVFSACGRFMEPSVIVCW